MSQKSMPLGHVPREGAAPRALITGITGQDGSYLAELLLAKGYKVHGLIRRASSFNTDRIDHLYQDPHEPGARLFLHYGDLDRRQRRSPRARSASCPDEVYNLGAQSHVRVSLRAAASTRATSTRSARCALLEAVRDASSARQPVASTRRDRRRCSALRRRRRTRPRRSIRAARTRSPRSYAHWYHGELPRGVRAVRCATGSCSTTSPRAAARPSSRARSRARSARIKHGLQDKLYLGNLDAKRDWGFAGDYVEAMWLMLQQDKPDDYVIATGEAHTVRESLEVAFDHVGLDWERHVEIDPRYFRPTEVDHLCGDSTKAREKLGWAPRVGFEELIRLMVDSDMELASQEATLKNAGHEYQIRGVASF